jgi:hypothetical protein
MKNTGHLADAKEKGLFRDILEADIKNRLAQSV